MNSQDEAEIKEFLEDLKTYGLRADLNPTTPGFNDQMEMAVWFYAYLRRINAALKERASIMLENIDWYEQRDDNPHPRF